MELLLTAPCFRFQHILEAPFRRRHLILCHLGRGSELFRFLHLGLDQREFALLGELCDLPLQILDLLQHRIELGSVVDLINNGLLLGISHSFRISTHLSQQNLLLDAHVARKPLCRVRGRTKD